MPVKLFDWILSIKIHFTTIRVPSCSLTYALRHHLISLKGWFVEMEVRQKERELHPRLPSITMAAKQAEGLLKA